MSRGIIEDHREFDLKAERQKTFRKWMHICFIAAGGLHVCAMLALGAVFLFTNDFSGTIHKPLAVNLLRAAIVLFAALLITGLVLKQLVKRLKRRIKLASNNYRTQALSEGIELVSYDPGGFMPWEKVRSVDFCPDAKRITGSDFAQGFYRGAGIAFSDIVLTHVDGWDEDAQHVVDFKGVFLELCCDESVQPEVDVIEFKFCPGYLKRKRTLTHELEFDKRYVVYTSEPDSAPRAVTPELIQSLMRRDAGINVFFKDKHVYLALRNADNLFEYKAGDDLNEYRRMCGEHMRRLLELADMIIDACAVFDKAAHAKR